MRGNSLFCRPTLCLENKIVVQIKWDEDKYCPHSDGSQSSASREWANGLFPLLWKHELWPKALCWILLPVYSRYHCVSYPGQVLETYAKWNFIPGLEEGKANEVNFSLFTLFPPFTKKKEDSYNMHVQWNTTLVCRKDESNNNSCYFCLLSL